MEADERLRKCDLRHRERRSVWVAVGVLAFIALFPASAHADAGIPMLPFAYPVVILALLPVIFVEAFYLRWKLRTDWWGTFAATARANAVSMVLGFPLAWLVCFLLELLFWIALSGSGIEARFAGLSPFKVTEFLSVVASAPWLAPVEEKWAIPVAYVALLVPSFVLSGFVESRMLNRDDELKCEGCSKAVWQANMLSYIFLATIGSIALYAVATHF